MSGAAQYAWIALLGLLLMVPQLWMWRHFWNVVFGFESARRYCPTRWLALVLFLTITVSGQIGAAMLVWPVADALARAGALAFVNADAAPVALVCGTGWAFCVPALIYIWKRSRFRKSLETTAPKCKHCEYPLRGLPVVGGRVRCPECGTENSPAEMSAQYRHDRRVLDNLRKRPWEV